MCIHVYRQLRTPPLLRDFYSASDQPSKGLKLHQSPTIVSASSQATSGSGTVVTPTTAIAQLSESPSVWGVSGQRVAGNLLSLPSQIHSEIYDMPHLVNVVLAQRYETAHGAKSTDRTEHDGAA